MSQLFSRLTLWALCHCGSTPSTGAPPPLIVFDKRHELLMWPQPPLPWCNVASEGISQRSHKTGTLLLLLTDSNWALLWGFFSFFVTLWDFFWFLFIHLFIFGVASVPRNRHQSVSPLFCFDATAVLAVVCGQRKTANLASKGPNSQSIEPMDE